VGREAVLRARPGRQRLQHRRGSLRLTRTKKITTGTWRQLVDGVDRLPPAASAPGCTGGSTYKVVATKGDTATKGNTTVRETSVYACGTANQDAAKALPEFIKPASSLFDIDALAR
jgi:hypothetical protein